MRFVDTNILLYRISSDPRESGKQGVAARILGESDLCLSVQVLQEFYVQATRRSWSNALLHSEAIALIESWKRFNVQPITVEIMDAALVAKDRWQLSYWDAAIIETARLCKCGSVLSEDLNAGQNFDGIVVMNPFRQEL